MFAVIKTGGKQYKVEKDQILAVEKIANGVGSIVVFDEVLSVTDGSKVSLGTNVGDVKVAAEILEQKRGEKVIVFKKRRRHNYRRKNGHRQSLTIIKVTDIAANLSPKLVEFAAPVKGESKKAVQTPKASKEPKAPKAEKATTVKKAAAPKKATAAKTTTKKPAAKKASA